jgi:DNA-binding response OmpR family regulator
MNSFDRSDIPASQRTQSLVLIVDDDRSLQMLLKVAMQQEGFEVAQSNSGEQCLRDYQRLQPDMILLDAVMPGIDGFECCRQIRQLPGAAQVPILMITVLDDAESVAQAFEAGATDYITKPIYWAVLSQRVRRLLESYQTTLEAQQVAEDLKRYQHWCQIQQQLLTTVQTLPLKLFLQKVLQTLQANLGDDRSCVALYQVREDLWLTPDTAPETLGTTLNVNLKLAPISDACLTWLKAQEKPITIEKPEAIEVDQQSSDSVPLFKVFQDSLQDLLSETLGSKIEIFPIFNQSDLQALLICSKIESENTSEVDLAILKNISEIITIAFQLNNS